MGKRFGEDVPPSGDLGDVLQLAFDDLDRVCSDECLELPVTVRTRVIHWLCRAYEAGRSKPRAPWKP